MQKYLTMFPSILFAFAVFSYGDASPAPFPNDATPTVPSSCTDITSVVPPTSATPFCSVYLSLSDKTVFTTISATLTVTVTPSATATSTSYVLLPGNPPAPKARHAERLMERNTCNRDNCLRNLVDARYVTSAAAFCSTYTATTTSIAVPTYIDKCGQPAIPSRLSSACSCAFPTTTSTTKGPAYTSSACSCLSLTTSTTTQTAIADFITTVIAATATPATKSTVYPCASPLPSPGPAYGLAQGSVPHVENSLFYINTPEGASAEACCNTCFFEIENCIQAFWYSYEGCVVSQGTDVNGTGQGISKTCPAGIIQGLQYGPDGTPPFRSTGDFAGPCGEAYANL